MKYYIVILIFISGIINTLIKMNVYLAIISSIVIITGLLIIYLLCLLIKSYFCCHEEQQKELDLEFQKDLDLEFQKDETRLINKLNITDDYVSDTAYKTVNNKTYIFIKNQDELP
jgi:hypothetical protein